MWVFPTVCTPSLGVLHPLPQVRPCLFINKLDRLVLELQLEPAEAYERLAAIVAHANMIVSAFDSEQYISEADAVLQYEGARAAADEAHRHVWGPGAMPCSARWGTGRWSPFRMGEVLSWCAQKSVVKP
jgi:hypothetical protein